MIADAIDKVGPDGVLSIESSSSFETTVDDEEGMEVSVFLWCKLYIFIRRYVVQLLDSALILWFPMPCRLTEVISLRNLLQILRN